MFDDDGPEPYETSPYNGDDDSDPGFYSDSASEDQSIDFRQCPNCGQEDFEIVSEERLYAGNQLKNLEIDDAGQLTKAEWGLTEPDYSSSTTLSYRCDSCGETLPERYQAEIDRVLDNQRDD